MLVMIENVLSAQELAQLRDSYAQARFGDGRMTAGTMAAEVKRNLQLPADAAITRALTELVMGALHRHPDFVSAALPYRTSEMLFNRYLPGMAFGVHVDNAVRLLPQTMRTDVSATLFLSDPHDYEGGELLIEDTYGAQQVKLAAGSLILYPSASLHKVEAITSGHRDVVVFWLQSMVRDDARRGLLYQLDRSIQSLRARDPGAPEILLLTASYHNLLRMWTDV